MKFFNKKTTSNLGSSVGRNRSFFRRIGRDPKVDWVLSIVACFIIFIIFVVIGIEKYLSYDQKIKDQVTSTKTKDTTQIDTKVLDNVLNRYDERIRVRDELIKGYNGPTDPSI